MTFLVYVLTLIFSIAHADQQRYVIGCENAGLFSNFYHVLNHLAWCQNHPELCPVVYWDERSAYWMSNGHRGALNVWEYYFEPVSNQQYQPGDLIHRTAPNPEYFSLLNHSVAHRYAINQIIERYVKIKPDLQKKIDDFYQMHMQGKKVIGIHLRGTDKWQEVTPVDPLEMLAYANSFEGCSYLIATDETQLLQLARATLKGEVIAYPCQRSSTVLPLHHPLNPSNKAQAGEEVLIEVCLLARCEKFIHTFSTVSSMVLFFNPAIESIMFGDHAYFKTWFHSWITNHPHKDDIMKMKYSQVKELYLKEQTQVGS